MKISAVILTYNEEKNIKACLENLLWADEIILIDGFSADATLELARNYTNKIYQRKWQGYSEGRNFGLGQASSEWVLFVDADERIHRDLAEEIRVAIERDKGFYDGYYIPRQSFYLGKWIKHGDWFPDPKLRLIKKGKGVWADAIVHEKLIVNGKIGYLKNPMHHYTCRDIAHHMEKFNRYSSLFAQGAFNRGENAKLRQLLLGPFIRFVRGYFIKQGFRDGFAGLVIAFIQSTEVFLRYAKLRERYK